MWKDALYRLKADPAEYIFVLTANRLFTEKDKYDIADIMWEEFGAEGLAICNESSFPMIWYGKQTGVYVDCGELITSVVVFHDGRRLSNNVLNFVKERVELSSYIENEEYDMITIRVKAGQSLNVHMQVDGVRLPMKMDTGAAVSTVDMAEMF
ncbi:uncharacterized protein LOC134198035 [Corticium candelabrum]|uniref:uncharacterized protein LOC134198035 n=1 Tax=Corticium candelabrum TaxID=121492 RepID=UPI002E273BD9|nr:uncharacterized protein LOC134198035 [Corticium candelabrum]